MSAALTHLHRWIYLMQQVHEASYYIKRAEELGRPPECESLEGILEFLAHFRSALNSYAKCFVSAGPGKITLQKDTVFKKDSASVNAHDRIMELRHTYIAHSDTNEIEGASVVEESNADELVLRLQYNFSFPFDRLYELRDLINYVGGYVVDRHGRHVASVGREIGKPVRIRQV